MQTVNRRVSCSLAEDADQRCMYACPPGLHELLQLWSPACHQQLRFCHTVLALPAACMLPLVLASRHQEVV